MDRVVSMLDKDISAEVDKTLKKGGASVNCGRKVLEIKDNGGHPVIVTDNGEFEVDKVLHQSDVQQTLDALVSLLIRLRQREARS